MCSYSSSLKTLTYNCPKTKAKNMNSLPSSIKKLQNKEVSMVSNL